MRGISKLVLGMLVIAVNVVPMLASAQAPMFGERVKTTITISARVSKPSIFIILRVRGYLRDVDGNPLEGKLIVIKEYAPDGRKGGCTRITDSNGYYKKTGYFLAYKCPSGIYRVTAEFMGDLNYKRCSAETTVTI